MLSESRVTLNTIVVVPSCPSVTEEAWIDTSGGGSSSVIVPLPVASDSVALVGSVRCTKKSSANASKIVSPRTVTSMKAFVSPAGMVTVPLVDEKSSPAVAVPLEVMYEAVTSRPPVTARETVKVMVVVPASPSTTSASPMDRPGCGSSSTIVPAAVSLAGSASGELVMTT